MNYYKVLGIEENASQDEIRQAYEKQVNTFKKEVKDQKRLKKFLLKTFQIIQLKLITAGYY